MAEAAGAEFLLVEDDQNDMELALRAMRKSTIAPRVIVLKDGAEALEFLMAPDRTQPWAVFLDIKMPRVDGLEVLRRIRSEPRTKHLPVIVLTGSKEERDLKNAHALGVTRYLTKPLTAAHVSSILAELGTGRS